MTRPEKHSKKRICIIQSCYIPWKGFFDLMGRCHEYVIFDEVQYAKRHWHNRNIIKTSSGPLWLTIPVVTKSRFDQPIDEVAIAEPWAQKHWRSILSNYRKAPHFGVWAPLVEDLYRRADSLQLLTEVNELFLRELATALSLPTRISRDRTYRAEGAKTDRLLDICVKADATAYLSGPSARDYFEDEKFQAAGIDVEWMAYGPYAEYPQLHGPFDHAVTVLDLMFNTGSAAAQLIAPVSSDGEG
jgi:hypothetical protein